MARGSSSPYGWQCLRCGVIGKSPERPCASCAGTTFECVALPERAAEQTGERAAERPEPRWIERIGRLLGPGRH